MHFSQAVSIIQSQVGTIRGVQVLYSDQVRKKEVLIKCMPSSSKLKTYSLTFKGLVKK